MGSLGLRSFAAEVEGGFSKSFYESTEMKIDSEVRKIIDECFSTRELRKHRNELEM